MTNPIIKICGLSTTETMNAAINAGADWVGLVSFEPSPRHVKVEKARILAGHARGRAKIVSLSVNADDGLLDAIVETVKPDILQFHGKESPGRVRQVKGRFHLPVMKAVGVSRVKDLENIMPYLGIADHILLDAKPPKDAILPGGNGAAFDWDILQNLPEDVSFMLSGGLNAENVHEAIERVKPFGVDVSSGVESTPGVKDTLMVQRFVAEAHSV